MNNYKFYHPSIVYGALTLLVLFLGCQGPRGLEGSDGYTPTITTSPASFLECPTGGTEITVDGKATTVVCNGSVGQPGQSIIGPKGDPGQNATPVTLVQFCEGTTSYPSVFLEYGLCIQNQIWGVYSANNGFLALLPPGQYASDAIGSTCNFTILENCQITH